MPGFDFWLRTLPGVSEMRDRERQRVVVGVCLVGKWIHEAESAHSLALAATNSYEQHRRFMTRLPKKKLDGRSAGVSVGLASGTSQP